MHLARKGRVRRDLSGLTVAEVAGHMDGREAAGLLHDGAGWDAPRIAAELSTTARQVRLDVARARLTQVAADCDPCNRHLDGLMTFAAEAIDHSMACAECRATRQALRQGKQALRDRWRLDGREDTPHGGQQHHHHHRRGGGAAAGAARPRAGPTPLRSRTPAPPSLEGRAPDATSRPVPLPGRPPGRTRLAAAQGSSAPRPVRGSGEHGRLRRGLVVVLAMATAASARIPRSVVVGVLSLALIALVVTSTWSQTVSPGPSALPEPAEDPQARASVRPVVVPKASPTATPASEPTPTPTPTPDPTPVPTSMTPAPAPTGPTFATWLALAQCESGSDWTANTGNGFYGGLQFTMDSWRLVDGTGRPDQHSMDAQIRSAEELLKIQGWVAWPVCSRVLGLR